MDRLRDILAAKAMAVFPGPGYNAFRGQQEDAAGEGGAPLFFEAALPSLDPEKTLAHSVVPALMRFLHRKKQSLEEPKNVLVALFLGETCFVLEAGAVLDVYCELEGIARQSLRFRVLSWID